MPFQEEEETAPKNVDPYAPVLLTWDPRLKPRCKNGLSKLFDLRGQIIDVSDQDVLF